MAQEMTGEQGDRNKAQRGIFLNRKLLILGFGAIVICALIAFAAVYLVMRESSGNPGGTGFADQAKNEPSVIGPLFEAGEFTTNLAQGGEKKFVKVKVVFELSQQSLTEEVKQKLPVLQDRILLFLNSKTSDDLSAENRPHFKDELLADLNRYLSGGKIMNLYFSDLVMQ